MPVLRTSPTFSRIHNPDLTGGAIISRPFGPESQKPQACPPPLLRLSLPGELTDLENNKLGGFEWSETDSDINDALIDVILSSSGRVTSHEKSLLWFHSLKRGLAPKRTKKVIEARPQRRPQRLIIRLEHRPLRAAIQTLLKIQGQAPHRDVLPFARSRVRAVERASAPDQISLPGEVAQHIDAQRIESGALGRGDRCRKIRSSEQKLVCRGFEHTACFVYAGINAGDSAARCDVARLIPIKRISYPEPRKINRRISMSQILVRFNPANHFRFRINFRRGVDDQEGSFAGAILFGF